MHQLVIKEGSVSYYFFMVRPGFRCGVYMQQVFAGIFVLLICAIKCGYIVSKIRNH